MADDTKPTKEFEFKLGFRIPSKTPSLYAHHMFVQPGEHEVLLTFFEVIPPPLGPNATEEEINIIKEAGIVAECVARITVSKGRFPAFANAMQEIADFLVKETAAKNEADKNDANS